MDTFTQVVPWPEQPTYKALVAWENGGEPYPATWAVHVTWAEVDGTLTPVGIDVRSYTTHDDGIRPTVGGLQRVTARGLRPVKFGDLVERSRTGLQAPTVALEALAGALLNPEAREHLRHPPDPQELTKVRDLAQERRDSLEPEPKRGRPPSKDTDDRLREVAQVYNQAVATGSRRPVRVVAEHFGRAGPRDFQPKGWVQAASKRGLIKRGANRG